MTDSDTTTVYLEMTARPKTAAPRPARAGMLLRLEHPTPRFYRYLYESVGGQWGWPSISDRTDELLAATLADTDIDVFVLYLGGEPVGFFELDGRRPGDVEVVRLGLIPEYRGHGLGAYLVAAAVEAAWDREPRRVWAKVDTTAHPRSLLVYQRAGFAPYETRPGRADEDDGAG